MPAHCLICPDDCCLSLRRSSKFDHKIKWLEVNNKSLKIYSLSVVGVVADGLGVPTRLSVEGVTEGDQADGWWGRKEAKSLGVSSTQV